MIIIHIRPLLYVIIIWILEYRKKHMESSSDSAIKILIKSITHSQLLVPSSVKWFVYYSN